jgi:hypothetical protein
MKIFIATFKTQSGATKFMSFEADSKELAVDHAHTVARWSLNNAVRVVGVKMVPAAHVIPERMGSAVDSRDWLVTQA